MKYIFVLLLLASNVALAETYPADMVYKDPAGNITTFNQLCTAFALNAGNDPSPSINEPYCDYIRQSDGQPYHIPFTKVPACKAGADLLDVTPPLCRITCTAPATFNTSTKTCGTPNPCEAGDKSSYGYPVVVGDSDNDSHSTCAFGCIFSLVPDPLSVGIKDSGGNWQYSAKLDTDTGNQCTASTTPKASPTPELTPEQKCTSQGQSFGTVNGAVVCFKAGTPNTPSVKTPKTTQTTNTANSTDGSASGSTSISTTNNYTVNSNGSVTQTTTTTTTTTDSNGTPHTTTTTQEKQQDKQSFCEQNPNLTICKTSTFGGACGAFLCDGDAIQCAIAKRAYIDRCEADDSKTILTGKAAYTTGQKLMNNDYDDDVKNFLNKSGDSKRTVNVPTSLSESGESSFGGNEIQDVHFSLLGQSVTVPFSNTNNYFNIFGYVLLGLAYLASYKYIASVV